MTLDVFSDILNAPDIRTFPGIPIIIQTTLSLCFRKDMRLEFCPDIPENLNIPVTPDIHDIPPIPDIPITMQIGSRLWLRKGMTLDVCCNLP